MTPLDADLVRRKLARIGRNLELLRAIEGLELADYQRDPFRLKGTERLLQETVESAVDVNLHILRDHKQASAPDYRTSFLELGRIGVLPLELAELLAPAAGLRNRLVHEYEEIDDAIVLRAIADARLHFGRYVAEVEQHLSALGV